MGATKSELSWLITGASRGFGRALVTEVLARGEPVVAAVREPSSLSDLVERHPGALTVVAGDLRDPGAVERVAQLVGERFGAVDVLVNNAGRAVVGAAEEVSVEQVRELMELNFFAAVTLTRAVLPGMRARGSGTIIQMSSQGGRLSFPGVGTYSATKFALEGWSEALAGEVAPFGIRVLLVEPSRFRTGFNNARTLVMAQRSSVYASVLDPVRADMAGADGKQEGDPARAARILVDLAHADVVPLRLPLGAEAVRRISNAYSSGLAGVQAWVDVARSADFPDAVPSARPV